MFMNLIRLSCAQYDCCLDFPMNSFASGLPKEDTHSISKKSRNVLSLRGHCRLVSGAQSMKRARGSSISISFGVVSVLPVGLTSILMLYQ